MPTLAPAVLVDQLKWRYATKKFDAAKKIPADVWAALEQALVLTPSSFGLQPWKFLVLTNQSVREKLVPASWGQTQPVECSHYIVFARKQDLSGDDINRYIDRIAALRGVTRESLAGFRGMMAGFRDKAASEGWLNTWADRQVYIALGNFMTAAATLGIDTCPMEGFEPPQYDEILGLPAIGYSAVVACAAGYRSANDRNATLPKVRFDAADMVKHI